MVIDGGGGGNVEKRKRESILIKSARDKILIVEIIVEIIKIFF